MNMDVSTYYVSLCPWIIKYFHSYLNYNQARNVTLYSQQLSEKCSYIDELGDYPSVI